jgi:spermidine synthase
MAQPWKTIETIETVDGPLELRQRGLRDFLILINGRVLMNSTANRSEIVLGELGAKKVAMRPKPRVLVGGLGMGLTLKAVLDALPADAEVVVAEFNPVVVRWCRGPLADLTLRAVEDPRVRVIVDDVAYLIKQAVETKTGRFDAIVIDLYEGPHAKTDAANDPFYGSRALKTTAAALTTDGIFAIWGESPDEAFEKRLTAAGFTIDRQRPGRGGLRHVVYVAQKQG